MDGLVHGSIAIHRLRVLSTDSDIAQLMRWLRTNYDAIRDARGMGVFFPICHDIICASLKEFVHSARCCYE
jgi:hypothetical protein